MNGFELAACTTVMRTSQLQEVVEEDVGTVDRERFEAYVEYDLVPALGHYALNEPNSIVVVDNAKIHTGPRTRELIEGAGARLIYTAPFSPDLNPIEPMFHVYKSTLKRHRIQNLELSHLDAMNSVTPGKARSFFAALGGAIRNVPPACDEENEIGKEIVVGVAAIAAAAAAVIVTKSRNLS